MEELEILLSDQFAEFARKVVELAKQKKTREIEFKVQHESYQNELNAMDKQILALRYEFENWKKERALNCGDG